jgi:hypothetical protein
MCQSGQTWYRTLKLWDVEAGKLLRKLEGNKVPLSVSQQTPVQLAVRGRLRQVHARTAFFNVSKEQAHLSRRRLRR